MALELRMVFTFFKGEGEGKKKATESATEITRAHKA